MSDFSGHVTALIEAMNPDERRGALSILDAKSSKGNESAESITRASAA